MAQSSTPDMRRPVTRLCIPVQCPPLRSARQAGNAGVCHAHQRVQGALPLRLRVHERGLLRRRGGGRRRPQRRPGVALSTRKQQAGQWARRLRRPSHHCADVLGAMRHGDVADIGAGLARQHSTGSGAWNMRWQRTGWAMRGDRRPGGGSGSQSQGECHRTKSARHAPGLAALNAAMSAARPGAASRARTSAPPSPPPSSSGVCCLGSGDHIVKMSPTQGWHMERQRGKAARGV